MPTEKLSWEQIKEQYPHQNVGLVDVEFATPQGGAILYARVVCTDKNTDRNDMAFRAVRGDYIIRYTTMDEDSVTDFPGYMEGIS